VVVVEPPPVVVPPPAGAVTLLGAGLDAVAPLSLELPPQPAIAAATATAAAAPQILMLRSVISFPSFGLPAIAGPVRDTDGREGGFDPGWRRARRPRDNLRPVDPMSIADRSWPVLRRLMGVHTLTYRATGGRVGHRFPGTPPMLLLDHVGAKSGKRRTIPLVYAEDGPNLILIASKGGHPRNPAWLYNLRAHPETTVQVGSERRPVHARVANAQERRRLWPKAVAVYGGYEGYQERTERKIPVVILEPRR
jgi:deazaflavin-dependent oxidoreductase (nitroreductase family)